jgi:hypothetical protein
VEGSGGEGDRVEGFCRGCSDRVVSGTALAHDGVETVVVVGRVVDCPDGTVWLNEAVLALNMVAVSCLGLMFDVAGVVVRHAVAELVLRNRLK